MEKAALEAQVVTDSNWEISKGEWASSFVAANIAPQEVCLKVDREGNVIFFDEENFVKLVEITTDPYTKALGAVYALGFVKGLQS